MKTRLLLAFFLLIMVCYTGKSQVPQGFNYQAIATDATNHPIANQTFLVKITLQTTQAGGTTIWEEQQSVSTNQSGLFSMVIGTGTRLAGTTSAFNLITWTDQAVYLKTTIQYPGSTWTVMGAAQVWSVPFSLVAEKANSVTSGSKLSVVSDDDAATDALFEVKRKDGQIVFAVYPDAVNVNVPNSTAKGSKGGFAIGGFGGTKAEPQDYFRVTPDSVRIYIDQTATGKGSKGGFAIGGYGAAKGGTNSRFFNLSGSSELLLNGGSAQVLWYPLKNAFLAGNVRIISPDSVGDYSTSLGYWSRAAGNYSQAFGYKAIADGDYSTSIGKKSVAGIKNSKHNAFAFGNAAKALGDDSYALGSGATASGYRSFAFGSVGLDASGNPTSTPTTASFPYTVAIGMGAQAIAKGGMALGVGAVASGSSALSLGSGTVANNTNAMALGNGTVSSGVNATAIGYQTEARGELSLAIGSNYVYSYNVPIINLTTTTSDVFLPTRTTTLATTFLRSYNRKNIAEDKYSVAIGNGNLARQGGLVFGTNSDALQFGALSMGTSAAANNKNSVAIGYESKANGIYSVAIGNNVTANSFGEFALGQFAEEVTGTADTWNQDEQLFTLGNGTSATDRSNALTIYKNGKTIIRGRYAYSTFNNKTFMLTYNPITHFFSTKD